MRNENSIAWQMGVLTDDALVQKVRNFGSAFRELQDRRYSSHTLLQIHAYPSSSQRQRLSYPVKPTSRWPNLQSQHRLRRHLPHLSLSRRNLSPKDPSNASIAYSKPTSNSWTNTLRSAQSCLSSSAMASILSRARTTLQLVWAAEDDMAKRVTTNG